MLNRRGPILFDDFQVEDPQIPSSDEECVMLCDEDTGVMNIYNLTRRQSREIIQHLDLVVQEVLRLKGDGEYRFRSPWRNINFTVRYFEDGGRGFLSILGRDIADEDDDEGSYCHDFEIEAVTANDWLKLKNLLG